MNDGFGTITIGAVFLGTGTCTTMQSGSPGEDLDGVYEALPYLVPNINHFRGWDNSYPLHRPGRRVVVRGGGMVHDSDVVVTAAWEGRQAAASIRWDRRRPGRPTRSVVTFRNGEFLPAADDRIDVLQYFDEVNLKDSGYNITLPAGLFDDESDAMRMLAASGDERASELYCFDDFK